MLSKSSSLQSRQTTTKGANPLYHSQRKHISYTTSTQHSRAPLTNPAYFLNEIHTLCSFPSKTRSLEAWHSGRSKEQGTLRSPYRPYLILAFSCTVCVFGLQPMWSSQRQVTSQPQAVCCFTADMSSGWLTSVEAWTWLWQLTLNFLPQGQKPGPVAAVDGCAQTP